MFRPYVSLKGRWPLLNVVRQCHCANVKNRLIKERKPLQGRWLLSRGSNVSGGESRPDLAVEISRDLVKILTIPRENIDVILRMDFEIS